MARKNKVVVPSVETIQSEVVELVETEVVAELVEVIAEQDGLTIKQAQDLVEVAQLVTAQPSLMAQLANQEVPVVVAKPEKNQGVGVVVKKMILDGMSNKDILVKLEELYGNKQTTYACVAWYRNKMKKAGAEVKKVPSALESVQRFLSTCTTISEEEKEGLLETVKQSA